MGWVAQLVEQWSGESQATLASVPRIIGTLFAYRITRLDVGGRELVKSSPSSLSAAQDWRVWRVGSVRALRWKAGSPVVVVLQTTIRIRGLINHPYLLNELRRTLPPQFLAR
jgi:hypothetical protein